MPRAMAASPSGSPAASARRVKIASDRVTAGAGDRSDSVEVNGVHPVPELTAVQEARGVVGEELSDQPVLSHIERGRVGADQHVRVVPQWAAYRKRLDREDVQ